MVTFNLDSESNQSTSLPLEATTTVAHSSTTDDDDVELNTTQLAKIMATTSTDMPSDVTKINTPFIIAGPGN